LCVICETEHLNHSLISKKEIQFNNDEIINIQNSIKKYVNTYNELLLEIKLWKKNIDEKIYNFEKNINNNEIFNLNEIIFNNDLSFNMIIKYRILFFLINNKPNNIDNNLKILLLLSPIYDEIIKDKNVIYNKYSSSKLLLKEVKRKNDFLLKSIEIIKYLNEINDENIGINNNMNINNNSLLSTNKSTIIDNNNNQINSNNIFSSNNINAKQLYVNYNIFPKNNESPLNKNEFNNIIEIKNPSNSCDKYKVIEKLIDLKRLSFNHKQKIIEETEIKFKGRINNNNNSNKLNEYNNTNSNDDKNKNKEIKFKEMLNNIHIQDNKIPRNIKNPNFDKQNLIYSKKKSSSNSSKTINRKNKKISDDKNSKTSLINNYLYDSNLKKINSLNFSNESLKRKLNKINNDIEISKFCTENKPLINAYTNKENFGKTYVHKKFLPNITINKNIIKLDQSNTEQKSYNLGKNNNNSSESEETGGVLFNKIFKDEQNKENNDGIKIININESIKNDNNLNTTNKNIQTKNPKSPNLFDNIKNKMQINKLNINIRKTDKNEKFHINLQKELYIGLELNNLECKMALINQNNYDSKIDINLINFNENNIYSIPTLISFDENNNSIKIGYQAYDLMEKNPTQTIFNIIKLIEADYDDIKDIKNYWPFKLYKSEEKNKLYIKIDFNGEKGKIFYIEDLLIIYLKKLFKLFFNKIEIDEKSKINDNNQNSNKNLSINLVVSVPNYFNYSHRKIIENIFKNNIFPNHKSINSFLNYNVIMTKFKIENGSSLSAICYQNYSLNQKQNNLLIINIDGCSINLSIVNIKEGMNRIYEVKNISYQKFGIEDFIDKFMYDCLSQLEYNSKKECIDDPYQLAKLRKSCKDAIYSFKDNDNTEINISKLYGMIGLKLIMNKKNYENSCKDMNDDIISNIKNLLLETKLNENDIDDIIIIGEKYSTLELKKIINEIFKENIKINNNIKKRNDNYDYDYFLASGAALQAFNISNSSPKYFFNDIIPFSFGIEAYNNSLETIIEKGTKIPIKCQKNFISTEDNQKNIIFNIYMGEHYICKKNKMIKKYNFKNLPEKEKGEIEIIVTFYIDKNWEFNCIFEEKKFTNKKEEIYIGNIYNIEKKYNEMSNKKVKIVMTDQSQIIENKEKEKIIKIINLSRSIDLCMKQGKMSKGEGFAEKRWILNKTRSIVDFNKKENYFNNLLFNKIVENDRYNQNNNQNL
jgi:molecular chaperone DnaK (HSP70)